MTTDERIHLEYAILQRGEQIPVQQEVGLRWIPCPYGGRRPLFVCQCGRQAEILYLLPTSQPLLFKCRRCLGLKYRSQLEHAPDRARRRERKIRRRLGGSEDLSEPWPHKPKWMRRATYGRLVQKAEEAAEISDGESLKRFAKILKLTPASAN